jgi:ribose transport system ATP-binding protein
MTAVLEARGIAKRFGAVQALRDASLRVGRGEVVALMGANGAGKSTLVKILTGAIAQDAGDIRILGSERRFATPGHARRAGLVPVYQEPALIPDLDIGRNLVLRGTPAEAFLRWADKLGIGAPDLGMRAGDLPLATQRVLDLAAALAVSPDVLMLDEMTAALPSDLADRVLDVVRAEADAGRAVIYISHRFAEIQRLCDRATVLRDGQTVGDLPVTPGVEEAVVELMLGQKLTPAAAVAPDGAAAGATRLAVRGLAAGRRLTDVSLELRSGEVLGVVALEGQGQDELFDVLGGFARPTAGRIEVDGRQVEFGHPAEAIVAGLALVPGNRADALLMSRSIRENIALPAVAAPRNWGPIGMSAEARVVNAAIARLQIDTRAQGEVRRLSGGNQQKVTIARWIARGAPTLLLFDPTRGIDVRTKRQIYALVRELAGQGSAILFYTSELSEIPQACDRVLVIFNGRAVTTLPAAEATEARLMRAAYGLAEEVVG